MARVTITISDDPTDGQVQMIADPPAMTLYERVKVHGAESLSPAEGIAISLFAHALTHGSPLAQSSRLILPPGMRS